MINQLIALCFRRRHLAWVIAILVAVYGYISWTHMAVEAYPDISDVTVQVTTQVPGLAAEEIEQQITTPLERALSNTPGVVTVRSSSTFALSLITLVFQDGTDDYFARQRVNERIAQVTLPAGVQANLGPISSPSGEIFRYTLESDSRNLMQLSELQKWLVVPALKQVAGIADVNNFGGYTKEFQLELDPAQLQRYGLSLNDVVTAINNNSANAGGGRIARGEQSYVVRGIGQIRTLDDLGAVTVAQTGGAPVQLRELGKLQFGHQEREGIMGKDRNPDSIEGIVLMLKGENPSRVLEGVHAKVAQLQTKLTAMGVRIVPYIDRDDLVELTVHKVTHTVLEGIGLVCIVLILFLGSPRSAIVAAVAIPIALVTVFIIMIATHMPANLFSLGAIDFGIIVDGAIVVMEAILRRREEAPEAALDEEDILETASQVARPIFFATLIIVAAYLPLFAFQRAEGKLFTPMAYTVAYALLGALICTLVLIPGLAFAALRAPRKIFQPPAGVADGEVPQRTGTLDGASAHRRRHQCVVPRRRGGVGGDSRSRILAGAGRRFLVAAGATAVRSLARQVQRDGDRIAPHAARIPGSILRRHAAGPQRRRHRSLDAVAHGSAGRPEAIWCMARWRIQGRTDRQIERALCPHARLRRRHQPAYHRRCQRRHRRRPQPAGAARVRQGLEAEPPHRRTNRRHPRHDTRHGVRLAVPGAADSADGRQDRPRGGGALRHQRGRYRGADPDRRRRRAGDAGVRRRPQLQRHRALPEKQQGWAGGAG